MCFTPAVSLITFFLEFAMAGFILLRFKRTAFIKFLVVILLVLGFYQFTEFMMCSTGNFELWGTFSFVLYTFLPPLVLHFALSFMNRHWYTWLLYLPAIVFSVSALLINEFILDGWCSLFFVSATTYFFPGIE